MQRERGFLFVGVNSNNGFLQMLRLQLTGWDICTMCCRPLVTTNETADVTQPMESMLIELFPPNATSYNLRLVLDIVKKATSYLFYFVGREINGTAIKNDELFQTLASHLRVDKREVGDWLDAQIRTAMILWRKSEEEQKSR